MKKIFYLVTLVAISLLFVQCEQNGKQNELGKSSGKHNGHEYVDLGLPSGLKWATCNIGASKPKEYGDYFAWGETKPKSYYDWSTYKYATTDGQLTKYCTDGKYIDYGVIDNKTILDPEDDAAHVNWGGEWRMPTYEEIDELINECEWSWDNPAIIYDATGFVVTGPNGNTMFLPATGCMIQDSLDCINDHYASYWSSSLYYFDPYNGDPTRAMYLYCFSKHVGRSEQKFLSLDRPVGMAIRPVCM